MSVGEICGILSAACNFFAGVFWVWSTISKVKTETQGMGAMLGGEFVWKDESGDKIDLGETLIVQAKWNKWAARFAAAGAILAAMMMATQWSKVARLLPECVLLCA